MLHSWKGQCCPAWVQLWVFKIKTTGHQQLQWELYIYHPEVFSEAILGY